MRVRYKIRSANVNCFVASVLVGATLAERESKDACFESRSDRNGAGEIEVPAKLFGRSGLATMRLFYDPVDWAVTASDIIEFVAPYIDDAIAGAYVFRYRLQRAVDQYQENEALQEQLRRSLEAPVDPNKRQLHVGEDAVLDELHRQQSLGSI